MLPSEDLVPGDIVLVEEGSSVPADGVVLRANDLTVNEAIVTGESFPVVKDGTEGNNLLYQGTMINSGKCYIRITQTGANTLLGRIGRQTEAIVPAPTPLQVQIGRFVRSMTVFGAAAFAVVLVFGYLRTEDWAQSLLLSLTLAMSAIPEEIPVAFSSFMALGAWRMARLGIVVRQPLTVESLGAVSVICLDKTGTLTENRMAVADIYDKRTEGDGVGDGRPMVVWFARLASEPEPFDAMELAIVPVFGKMGFGEAYGKLEFIHEYPLEGKPPMMTHVYRNGQGCVAAAKGGVERMVEISRLSMGERLSIERKAADMAGRGYRVLGVASAVCVQDGFPLRQDEFDWRFEGLIAFNDPPKANLAPVLADWTRAGIRIRILSGDHVETVVNIAAAAGVASVGACLTGDQVMAFSAEELGKRVADTVVFARMFPEAKLRVVEALKSAGETVGMTGDGVNDGPALKAANIGIAMGARGTETARQAADLVISDDNLEKITEAIRHGRTIYANLKSYPVSDHDTYTDTDDCVVAGIAGVEILYGVLAYPPDLSGADHGTDLFRLL
ncbi:cation-translocating P-type ATPase [Puia sp. P3]|uniref:cation-translocating P-type ATPase n=1 Tax=Puia sp. P3 TaxID=3423952 RepID=UPI003D66DA1F